MGMIVGLHGAEMGRTVSSMDAPEDMPAGYPLQRYPPAVGCTAPRSDGEPCRRLAIRGGRVCVVHGGRLPTVREAAKSNVEAARLRVLGLVDPALDAIEKALTDPDVDIRLKAAREVLERVVPRHGSLSVTLASVSEAAIGKSPSEIISERLDKLRAATDARNEAIRRRQQPASPFGLPAAIEGEWSTSDE